MELKLVLAAYVLPGLAIVFGLPMAFNLVPPNRFYGFRTRKTLSSSEVWYRANRFSGWCLAVAGVLALCHNMFFQSHHAQLPPATQLMFMNVSTGILIFLGLILSVFYVRKL